MTDTAVWCEQDGCPIAEEGRCLEGFSNGEGCPHLRTGERPLTNGEAEPASPPGEDSDVSVVEANDELTREEEDEQEGIDLGGDQSLSLREADEVAARYGGRVVLVAGEHKAGKTTLVAEIYAQFLEGPYRDHHFAGSDTLIALDSRFHGARASSGLRHPDMPRTQEEDMRFLDLRMRSDSQFLSFLFSDVRGEFFDNVTQGAPVSEEIPIARRADLTMILINGRRINDPFRRAEAMSHARQLLGGLTDRGGVPDGRPLAIVLTKADVVESDARTWFLEQTRDIQEFAHRRGCGPSEVFVLAARPRQAPFISQGLDPLFDWLADVHGSAMPIPPSSPDEARSFWTV